MNILKPLYVRPEPHLLRLYIRSVLLVMERILYQLTKRETLFASVIRESSNGRTDYSGEALLYFRALG